MTARTKKGYRGHGDHGQTSKAKRLVSRHTAGHRPEGQGRSAAPMAQEEPGIPQDGEPQMGGPPGMADDSGAPGGDIGGDDGDEG